MIDFPFKSLSIFNLFFYLSHPPPPSFPPPPSLPLFLFFVLQREEKKLNFGRKCLSLKSHWRVFRWFLKIPDPIFLQKNIEIYFFLHGRASLKNRTLSRFSKNKKISNALGIHFFLLTLLFLFCIGSDLT